MDKFGGKLVYKEGVVDASSKLTDDLELIGIYFSAHWCPPCRGFTPKLADFYNKVNANGRKLEIVFVSHDRDESSFKGYFNEMPWCAIPFDEESIKEKLITEYSVSGIPALVFIKKDGSTASMDGRSLVMQEGSEGKFPWN